MRRSIVSTLVLALCLGLILVASQSTSVAANPSVPGQVNDLDRDGHADLIVWRTTTGEWYGLRSQYGYARNARFYKRWGNGNTDVPLLGDLDRDRRSDLIVWRKTTGEWYGLLSSRGYARNARFYKKWGNGNTDIPMLGDLDGDGRSDLIVWRKTTGEWYGLLSSRGYARNARFYKKWGNGDIDIPMLGDLDGDGRSDLIVWRKTTGEWYALLSGRGYARNARFYKRWGNGLTDIPMLGDLDRDGRSDLIVWRKTTGEWYGLLSSRGYARNARFYRRWGNGTVDVPLLEDLDEDGRSDLIVWRTTTGEWYALLSSLGYARNARFHKNWGNGRLDFVPGELSVRSMLVPTLLATAEVGQWGTREGLMEYLAPFAQAEQRDSGVPASFSIAQAIWESGWGEWFARTYHNWHGIHCSQPNEGMCVEATEGGTGRRVRYNRYSSDASGFLWHGRWLRGNGNYAPAFNHTDDPFAFARAVLNCYTGRTAQCPSPGSKTFPQSYYNFIVDTINGYNLRRFDNSQWPENCPDQYRAEYYNNPSLDGRPVFVRCEDWPIDHDWGNGGPGNGVPSDNFSVRWTGRAHITTGRYDFIARTDDGMRVSVGNNLIINEWRDQSATVYRETRYLSDGTYDIEVEYYERFGDALAEFRWVESACDGDGIGSNQTVSGWLSNFIPNESYCYEGSAGQWLSIRMFAHNSNLDPKIKLYSPNGQLLAENDDGTGIVLNSFLAYQLPESGTYRIEAARFGTTSGDYRLRLEDRHEAAVGDIDRNCIVNTRDVSLLMSRWDTADQDADLNLDGNVGDPDADIARTNLGVACP